MTADAALRFAPLSQIAPSAWDAVTAGRALPTQQYIWAAAAAEAFDAGPDMPIAVIGPLDAPHALAQFVKLPTGAGRYGWIAADTTGEIYEVIARDQDAANALAGGLARLGRCLDFGHYPADTPWVDALRRAHRGRGIVMTLMRTERCMPSIALTPAWLDPIGQMLARQSDMKRKAKAAAKIGVLGFQCAAPSSAELAPLLEEALAVETRSWKGRAGTAVLCNPAVARFFRAYGARAAKAGILRLFFLRIGGVTAAAQIAVETEDAFWQLKIGFDEQFQKVSPGNLLMAETIRWSVQRGLKTYHFYGKEADWTRDWTLEARPCLALRTYPFNPLGLAAAGADGVSLAWRAAKRKLGR